MKRIIVWAAAGVLVATPAVGSWTAFGSTDDAGGATAQVRVDDRHHTETEPRDDHGRHRHAADDGARHHLRQERHHLGHGADDPVGHVRHGGEAEPGDDHGRHGDHGGQHGGRHGGGHGGGDDGPGHD